MLNYRLIFLVLVSLSLTIFSFKTNKIRYYGKQDKTIKEYKKEKCLLILNYYKERYEKLKELNKTSLITLRELKEAELNFKLAELDYIITSLERE